MSKRRFAVLGLGQLGRALCRELTRLGCEVLAVDASPRKVEAVRDDVTMAAAADIRDREAMKELFTTRFDAAIIAIGGSLEAAIMATLYLKELGVREVWAEANTEDRAHVLERIGVTRIVSPERDIGRRIAQRLANPDLMEFLPLAEGYGVVEIEAPSWSHGRTLADLDLRRTMNLAVIAIRKADGGVAVVPGGATKLEHKDMITLVGRDEDLTRFRERK
jgi:trk system potassium uptake protein TrkA